MKMTAVRTKAKKMGLKTGNYSKANLIRKIQEEEGNTPCFQIDGDSCQQYDCCWRPDCLT
jgi:hypothetical protein